MNGGTGRKLLRLAAHLACHPRHLAHYARCSWPGADPLTLELPWFSLASIEFLDRHLGPDMLVYEYGSGGSTVFFAARAGRVVSMENDTVWAERVRARTGRGTF